MKVQGVTRLVRNIFSAEQQLKSSTWRELFAICFSLDSFQQFLSKQCVMWNTDNSAASLIVKHGSKNLSYSSLVRIFLSFVGVMISNLVTAGSPGDLYLLPTTLANNRIMMTGKLPRNFFDIWIHFGGPLRWTYLRTMKIVKSRGFTPNFIALILQV